MPASSLPISANDAQAAAAFFNAQQSADPLVCKLRAETLSDGSTVWNVAFIEELVFSFDRDRAEHLIQAVNKLVKGAQ